jgi:hypothetical protein
MLEANVYFMYQLLSLPLFSQVGGKLSSLTFETICRSLHSLSLYLLLSLIVNASEAKPSCRQQVGFGFTGIYTEISEAET